MYLTQKLVPQTQNTWHCLTSLGEQGTNCPWRLEKQNCYWKLERWWVTSLSSKTTGKTSKCVFLAKKLAKKCSSCPLVSFSSVWGMGRGTWKREETFHLQEEFSKNIEDAGPVRLGPLSPELKILEVRNGSWIIWSNQDCNCCAHYYDFRVTPAPRKSCQLHKGVLKHLKRFSPEHFTIPETSVWITI